MIAPAELTRVTDDGVTELLAAEQAVLVLTLSGCEACAAYEAALLGARERGLAGVALGKLVLDAPGAPRFKRANRWLGGVEFFPYTLVYARGRLVEEFATSKASYLLERLAARPAGECG